MFKYFLLVLLIGSSSIVICVDIGPEPFVKTELQVLFFEKNLINLIDLIHIADFSIGYLDCLTPRQLETYKRQINDSVSTSVEYIKFRSPLEYAALLGEAEVVDWLLLNGAKISPSKPYKPLKCALNCGIMNWHNQSKTVSALLAAGASTKGLIKGMSFLDFMRRQVLAERCSQATFSPSDCSIQRLKSMEAALAAIQQHEQQCNRWSEERAAWSSAVLRGRARVKN